MMGFLFVIVGIAVFGIIGYTKNRNEDLNRAWSSVAQKLDIAHRQARFGTSPLLSGFVGGRDLTVDIHKKRRGQNNKAFTRFRLGLAPLGLGLKLKTEGFFDGISKAFGAKDITLGDPDFDAKVFVKGNNEAVIREYLTPERRRIVLNFLSSFAGAVITDDEISFSSSGYARSADDVLQTINAMVLVAETLSEMRDDAGPAELEPLTALPTDAPPETKADLAPDAHFPPESEPEVEPAFDTAIETPAEPGVRHLVAATDSPAVNEFCDGVFAPGTLSFDATQSFKKGFEGKRVVWSGTLESASPFTVDFDFGSTGGVRAVLSIDASENTAPAARPIKAVIGLPVGTEGLENRVGQEISFAGTLRKVDGFGRKVYIGDAELA